MRRTNLCLYETNFDRRWMTAATAKVFMLLQLAANPAVPLKVRERYNRFIYH
jgi:hypothetical protein